VGSIHDEQNQFARFMQTAYSLTTKWEFSSLPLAKMLFPTTLVGRCPQPEWLSLP